MKLLLVSFGLLLYTINLAYAQAGKVEITKDPKIDALIARRLELSKKGQSAQQISGFRVQIYSGSDRKMAYAEQARFKGFYPEVFAYITFIQPNYKIRVGDFRTRIEAEKFKYIIKSNFSDVFIFPDQISPR